jgi:hypothetical protein
MLRPGRARGDLPAYRINRARNLIILGDEANDRKDFAGGDSYFRRALDDLAPLDPQIGFQREYNLALAKHGLGRSASGSKQHDRAADLFREALGHLREARELRIKADPLSAKAVIPALNEQEARIDKELRDALRAIEATTPLR